jgi:D-lactate dehydrogenase
MLRDFKMLPVQGEYIHRSAFALTQKYGKDTFLAIRYLGAKWLPKLFKLKSQFDNLTAKSGFLPKNLSDRMMQWVLDIFPDHLPERLIDYHATYEHHLILRMAADGI